MKGPQSEVDCRLSSVILPLYPGGGAGIAKPWLALLLPGAEQPDKTLAATTRATATAARLNMGSPLRAWDGDGEGGERHGHSLVRGRGGRQPARCRARRRRRIAGRENRSNLHFGGLPHARHAQPATFIGGGFWSDPGQEC